MENKSNVPLHILVSVAMIFDISAGKYLHKFRSPLIKFPFNNISEGNHAKARTITFDQEIHLPNDARQRCQSQELKDQGSFIISKEVEKFGKKVLGIKYSAYLNNERKEEEDSMGHARSLGKGDCDEVDIEEEYRGCRLGTFLMQACLEDDQVGFYNIDKLPERRSSAHVLCKDLKFLQCSPDPNPLGVIPWEACSAYLTAAMEAGYELIFVSNGKNRVAFADEIQGGERKTYLLQIGTFKKMFKSKGADSIIQYFGKYWTLCKCKADKVDECENPKSNHLFHFYFYSCVKDTYGKSGYDDI